MHYSSSSPAVLSSPNGPFETSTLLVATRVVAVGAPGQRPSESRPGDDEAFGGDPTGRGIPAAVFIGGKGIQLGAPALAASEEGKANGGARFSGGRALAPDAFGGVRANGGARFSVGPLLESVIFG